MNTTKYKITLDENHVYAVDGLGHKPSVSQVLALYFPPSKFFTEEGRMKGTSRHKWFDALAQGLDIANDPDERIVAEVVGFRKFLSEVKPVYFFGEVALYDDCLEVCGKPDLYCEIQGRPSVVDYKPRNAQGRWVAQIAAYQCLLIANGFPVLDRYILRVLPGDYRLDQYKNPADLTCWRAFVQGFKALEAMKCRVK